MWPKRALGALLVVALAGAAFGYVKARYFRGPPHDLAAEVVPGEVDYYLSIFTEPSSAQERYLHSMAVDGDTFGADTVPGLLDGIFGDFGLDYGQLADDVGSQIAVYGTAGHDALLVETDDDLQPRGRFTTKRVGSLFVVGERRAVSAVSDDARDRLADDSWYEDAVAGTESQDRLAILFRFTTQRFDLPRSLAALQALTDVVGNRAIVLRAADGHLVFEGNVFTDGAVLMNDFRPLPLDDLSGETWLLAQVPNVDHTVVAINRGLRKTSPDAARTLIAMYAALFPGNTEWKADEAAIAVSGSPGAISAELRSRLDELPERTQGRYRPPEPLARLPDADLSLHPGARNVLRIAYGSVEGGDGGLIDQDRFVAATGWLDDEMEVVGYLDAREATERLGPVADALRPAGISLNALDRIAFGLHSDVRRTPSWRVAVSFR